MQLLLQQGIRVPLHRIILVTGVIALLYLIASAIWKTGTPNIRQCIKIAKMTKKKEDVDWLIQTIEKYQDTGEDWNE
ncbi:MAG: hypothetical protein WB988_23990 [Candidatus Nitrosopolaris sp.]|jgi:hypothetical protein